MAFDFKKSLIKVQGGQQYLPVSARIVWFREVHPDWAIVTEPLEINHEKQFAIFRATIFNAEGKIMATGTKKEDVKGFGDYMEKAETGSVGRALALCGFGTQFSPELDEVGGGRLADSPQPTGGRYGNSYGGGAGGGGGYRDNNRYGGDGNRSAGSGRDAGPTRSYNAPAPSPPPPAASERSAIDRSTEAGPASVADDDDFDAFSDISALAETDGAVTAAVAAPTKNVPAKAESRPDGPPACGSCGKALTKAQQEISIRNYGEALCPNCQRDKRGSTRPAAVAEH